MRKRWIQINGELVPYDQAPTESYSGITIIPDIQPYQSMITGEMITSRSKHREHLREHNCIEVGNEKITPKPVTPPPGLREALERAAYSTK